jgi:4-hydroxyacetophenone monooxygenase
MTSVSTGSAPGTESIDDLYWRAAHSPIGEDDAELERIARGAELPVLLVALAAALDDPSILAEDLRPPLTPMDTAPVPHGGMSPQQQERAVGVALEGLKRLRDEGITSVGVLADERRRELLAFLTGGRDDWFNMLSHELALTPTHGGRPDWRAEDIAADRDFPVLVVGAGVGGIAAAYRIAQTGLPYVHIEAGDSLGGTWAKNTYPGVRLDTPTFGYSYSFAQRGDWPHQFAEGGEIADYLNDVVDRAGLRGRIEFGTRLVQIRWNETDGAWEATTVDREGSKHVRRFAAVVSGLGLLDRPNIPEFDGAEHFRGATMHSQEWNHGVDLADKRVVVIGTGASAYQIVPAIVDEVASLTVFQRSAPWMLPAPNYHDEVGDVFAWLVDKVPHFAQWYRLWVILTGIEGRAHTVTVEDGWQGAPLSISRKNQELRDYLTARIEAQLASRPDLLRIAIPGYPPGAKRMLRDNGVWARALLDPKTTVVTSGIDRFTETEVVDGDGVAHEADVVIYATGFRPSEFLEGIEVIGRDNIDLQSFWAGNARAYNGVTVPGFPNLFLIYGPNVGGVVQGSLHFMIERAAEFALKSIREVLERGVTAIDVRPEALDRFVDYVDAGSRRMAWGQPYVRTWYQNSSGRVTAIWPYTNVEYWDLTERVDPADHDLIP